MIEVVIVIYCLLLYIYYIVMYCKSCDTYDRSCDISSFLVLVNYVKCCTATSSYIKHNQSCHILTPVVPVDE